MWLPLGGGKGHGGHLSKSKHKNKILPLCLLLVVVLQW